MKKHSAQAILPELPSVTMIERTIEETIGGSAQRFEPPLVETFDVKGGVLVKVTGKYPKPVLREALKNVVKSFNKKLE